jgi:hypothetical protein
MMHRVFWWKVTDVSDVLTASIFRAVEDDGGGKHLWNVGKFLSDCTEQQPRRFETLFFHYYVHSSVDREG